MGKIFDKLFLKLMKLRETAAPGTNLGLFRSSTRHPQTAIIMTRAVVLTSIAGGILVHPHNLCFKLHILGLSFKKYILHQIRRKIRYCFLHSVSITNLSIIYFLPPIHGMEKKRNRRRPKWP